MKPAEIARWPRPFVIRMEVGEDTSRLDEFLSRVVADHSIIQIELSGRFGPDVLETLFRLDRYEEEFRFSLQTPGLGDFPGPVIGRLRRLRKLSRIGFSFRRSAGEAALRRTAADISMVLHSGLRSYALICLEKTRGAEENEKLATEFLKAGAENISIRWQEAGIPVADPAGEGEPFKWTADYSRPVVFDECGAGLPAGITTGYLSCRGGYGSCYVSGDGTVKPCRLSNRILGDLNKSSLDEIWKDIENSPDDLCPMRANEKAAGQFEPSGPFDGTFNMEAGLCPVPLFKLRPESWGATLIKDLDGLALSRKGALIAGALDGLTPLRAVKKKFGHLAVNFVLALFMKNFIRFETRGPAKNAN